MNFLAHRSVDRVSLAGLGTSFTESTTWSECYINNDMATENEKMEVGVQTAETGDRKQDARIEEEDSDREFEQVTRDVAECLKVMNSSPEGTKQLVDAEIINLVESKHIAGHQLEKALCDPSRGVRVRRKIYMKRGNLKRAMETLPYQHFDYSKVTIVHIFHTIQENIDRKSKENFQSRKRL